MRIAVAGLLVAALLVPLSLQPATAQWLEAPGTGWAKLQVSHHDTERRFDEDGDVISFFNKNARSITTTVRFVSAIGLLQGVDAWVDAPYHRLQFNDVIRDRLSAGLGDPRVFLRTGPSLLGIQELPVAVALRAGTKFPVGDFNVDAEVIPLSEGQQDWEVLLEVGRSLHPTPMYVMGWVGYRWREANETTGLKPGNERFFYAAAGGSLDPLSWKLALDGYFGEPTEFSGLVLERERRELIQLIPTLRWTVGPGHVQAGARIPLHGRNLPAGTTFTLGYFLTWNDSLW